MAKHHPDLVFCRKQPGISLGRLCEKCDGKCVVCDSYVRPHVLVHICDECNYGSFEVRSCEILSVPFMDILISDLREQFLRVRHSIPFSLVLSISNLHFILQSLSPIFLSLIFLTIILRCYGILQ